MDMIGKSLREKQMHLLVKDGSMCLVPLLGMQGGRMLIFTVAILRYLYENELPISDEKKAAFYTEAELNVRCPFLDSWS